MILIILFFLFFLSALKEVSSNRISKKEFYFFYSILSFFVVFRYGVGADYPGYYIGFYEIPSISDGFDFLKVNAHGEPGYKFLVALFRWLGFSFRELSVFIGIISMYLYSIFFKRICNYSVFSLFLFYSIYFIIYPFNVIRQGLTIAIFLCYLLPLLLSKKYIKYTLGVLCSALFHYSILIALILPIVIKLKLSTALFVFIAVLSILFPLEFFVMPLLGDINVVSPYAEKGGEILALLNRIIFIIPSYLLYYKRFLLSDNVKKILIISLFGFIVYLNFFSYSLISSRIGVYMKILEICLIPLFVRKMNFHPTRIFVFLLVSGLLLVIFLKSLETDIAYLKLFNNIPGYYTLWDYPIINDNFQPSK